MGFMRSFALLGLLIAGSAAADPYTECLDRRHAIYTEASNLTDFEMRGHMLATMPTCRPGMVDDGSIASAAAEANAVAQAARIRTREPEWQWSVTFQPFPILRRTVYLGFELAVARRFGVGLHGGVGRTQHVQVGSQYHWYYTDGTDEYRSLAFTEMQIGAHASYYLFDDMEGVHVGGDVTYQHFGDPTAAERVTNPWISIQGLSMSGYVGWKTVTREGITILVQAGPMFTGMQTDNKLMEDTDWSFDRSVHLYTQFAGGWSF